MKADVYNCEGVMIGREVELRDDIFSIAPNDHSIYLDVKCMLANKRQGTSKAKEKWEIIGSTRKLKKQKGTGTARAGSIKSPLFRGGARVFGPGPRDYDLKINKKTKKLAHKSALAYKLRNQEIVVLDKMECCSLKTKKYLDFLRNFDAQDKKVVVVLSEMNRNLYLASKNLKLSVVLTFDHLNTHLILGAQKLFIEEAALVHIEKKMV